MEEFVGGTQAQHSHRAVATYLFPFLPFFPFAFAAFSSSSSARRFRNPTRRSFMRSRRRVPYTLPSGTSSSRIFSTFLVFLGFRAAVNNFSVTWLSASNAVPTSALVLSSPCGFFLFRGNRTSLDLYSSRRATFLLKLSSDWLVRRWSTAIPI